MTFPHTNLLFKPFHSLLSQTLQLNVYNTQNRLNDLHLDALMELEVEFNNHI